MDDLRRGQGLRGRLYVTFTSGGRSRSGFTPHLSPRGILFRTPGVFVSGTRLTPQLELRTGYPIRFEAEVVWAKRMRTDGGLGLAQSMGLRFVEPPSEDYFLYLAEGEGLHRELPAVRRPPVLPAEAPKSPARTTLTL